MSTASKSNRTTHTPGPWETRFSEMGGYDCMTHAWHIGSHSQGVICEVDLNVYGQKIGQWDFRSAEAEATAHLIAAAPELLEALKAIVDIANETIDGVGHRYTFDYNSPLGRNARAAIAKAEGR